MLHGIDGNEIGTIPSGALSVPARITRIQKILNYCNLVNILQDYDWSIEKQY